MHALKSARRWAVAPFVLGVAAASVPYFVKHDWVLLEVAIHHGFSLVCHQRPERSFWIYGVPIAVCSRCLGLYIGAAIGLLVRTSRRVALRLLLATTSLNLLGAVAEISGLPGNWLALRFALGLALGASAGMLLTASRLSDASPTGFPEF